MTIDKDKLRALAEVATQGDWGQDGTYFAKTRKEGGTMYVESWRPIGQAFSVEDAKFIAAASPSTVLALLGEIERLKVDAVEWRKAKIDADNRAQDAEFDLGRLRESEYHNSLEVVTAELDNIKAENEALRLDAERYRWLKGCCGDPHVTDGFWGECRIVSTIDDEAIDAAMTEERSQ